MKKSYCLFAALMSAVTIASCSDSDDMPIPADNSGKEIRFAANTEYSRATETTTNNLTTFNVYAYTGTATNPKLFMSNVTVNKTGTNTWSYSPVQYWPANETVDFYAFSPASWVGTSSPLEPIPYDAYPDAQDIVYAVSPDLRGDVGQANAQVVFNFRHALSKITVKMRSTNTNLAVRVTNVVLNNIMTKGNFIFPTSSTSDAASSENVGKWIDQNTPNLYILHMAQALSEIITLSTTPTVFSQSIMGTGGRLFVLPQPLTWRNNGSEKDTFLTVMCSIYDVKSGAKLWPNENTPAENIVSGSTFGDGLLKFPLSTSIFSEWHPGCHYIYNVNINSNEEMGAIEFGTPTVDTFIDVESNYE